MGYRVRNQYGEIQFESFDQLKDAFQNQLVEPDDEVLETGSTNWRKASSYPRLVATTQPRSSVFSGTGRWYLLAAVVFVVGIGLLAALRSGIIGFVIVLGAAFLVTSVFTWMGAKGRRR